MGKIEGQGIGARAVVGKAHRGDARRINLREKWRGYHLLDDGKSIEEFYSASGEYTDDES